MVSRKVNRFALGVWVFIAIVIIGSNSIVQYLSNIADKATLTLLLSVGIILLAYYHMNIAKILAGVI